MVKLGFLSYSPMFSVRFGNFITGEVISEYSRFTIIAQLHTGKIVQIHPKQPLEVMGSSIKLKTSKRSGVTCRTLKVGEGGGIYLASYTFRAAEVTTSMEVSPALESSLPKEFDFPVQDISRNKKGKIDILI